MKHQINTRLTRGFSLVEMLVVIAVIGIIAGIAVPSIGSISGEANVAKAKRNAQTVASLYNTSRGVGAVYTATSIGGLIDELIAGKTGAEIAGSEFRMSDLSEADKTAALAYVSYDSDADIMSFDPTGGQDTSGGGEIDNAGPWNRLWPYERREDAAPDLAYIANYPNDDFQGHSLSAYDWQVIEENGRFYLENRLR